MSFAVKDVVCKCCGHKFQARWLKGFFSAGADLDSNPHQPEIYEKAVLCPHCGYATSRINAEVDSAVRDAVSSSEYQNILTNEIIPEPVRRLVLDAKLMCVRCDDRSAGYQYLTASWYAREHECEYRWLLEKAEECFAAYLESNADVDAALVLIDVLRQLGKFSDVRETANSLSEFASDSALKKVLLYEQSLADAGVVQPHSRNEVPV